jgi:hypothetical protein
MKPTLLVTAIVILSSCNNSGKEKGDQQQKQIDSLTSVINQQNDVKKAGAKNNALINERNSVFKKVTTSKPSFDAVSFGGFRNISFNLFNDYNYELDQVIVQVHYIRGNGSEIKTEQQTLHQIAPKSHLVLNAPDYLASGKELRITLEGIICKAINLCAYNSQDSVASSDPYKCR